MRSKRQKPQLPGAKGKKRLPSPIAKSRGKGTQTVNHQRRDQDKPFILPSLAETPAELAIVAALRRCGGNGVPPKALMREARLSSEKEYERAVESLLEKGEIRRAKDGWLSLRPQDRDVPAVMVSLSEHFAFAKLKNSDVELFIPGAGINGAFPGDEVLLWELKDSDRGPSAKVQKILKRGNTAVTGTVHLDPVGGRVTPDGPLRYDLRIASQDLNGAKEGDKVLVKPLLDGRGDWSGAIVEHIFGSGDSARVCADAIIRRLGIPYEFPEEVLLEAREISRMSITLEELESRLDLSEEPIFTIDSADAKDLDDAISVLRTAEGYSLGVHIADVSHYVKDGSAIDTEARLRGTSVYFADRVIPMLPEELSNGVCSLNAGEPKLCFSALMDFDEQGNMTDYLFKKTVIVSKVRGVYAEVNRLFDGSADESLREKYAPVWESLCAARELADILRRRGEQRGEMDLSSSETSFVLDENGVCVDLLPRVQGQAEQLIEQMMIAANIAAAKASLAARIPFLYRVHEPPKAERVAELSELLGKLSVPCLELAKGNPKTGDFAAVLERVKGGSLESLVNMRILRTMEKARYAEKELGHFGLALEEYSHFTSPIRRYPDTAIHRILSDLAQGDKPAALEKRYKDFAKEAAESSSACEVRAVTGERAAEDCYVAEYLRAHLGEEYVGVISGVTPKGLFVQLENNAEGFVSLTDFPDADFAFDGEISHRDLRSGRVLMVGQELAIIVAGVDVATGRVDFVPALEQKE